MKVVVLTTSYPRGPDDPSGRFLADAVEQLRGRGVDIDVVAPGRFRDFGIAGGAGVLGNLRARPWLGVLLPALLVDFTRAARSAAGDAELVHAHWLGSALPAYATGKPVVLTLHGSDVELARRVPAVARRLLQPARLILTPSKALADDARALGAARVRVVPNGVEIPPLAADEAEPPEVLFAGRLSAEKGILDLVAAADGLNLVVVGDGPLREQVPGALGFVSRAGLVDRYERAAVVACPSHREGFGVVCAEAMAYGKPVVAGDVGGLRELVAHEETGLLVPPRDVAALRAALDRLLADPGLRQRYGAAGRARVRALCSWERVVELTLDAYYEALSGRSDA